MVTAKSVLLHSTSSWSCSYISPLRSASCVQCRVAHHFAKEIQEWYFGKKEKKNWSTPQLVGCPLGGLLSRWSAGSISSRNSQRLCCLAPPPPSPPPWRNALCGRCNNDCIISFQSARRPSMHPLATHHPTHITSIIKPVGHQGTTFKRRPPDPLCWIYILIRKPVGGRRGPLRVVMSLFWTQGVLPGTVRWYLRPGSADLDQGLTGGER